MDFILMAVVGKIRGPKYISSVKSFRDFCFEEKIS